MPTSNPSTQSRIFDSFPERVQSAIIAYANEAELSLDAVITFAIAHFLDPDSVTFDDCLIGLQRDQVELH